MSKVISKLKIVLVIIIVLIVIFLSVSFIAKHIFDKKVEKEIEELLSKVKNEGEIVTEEDVFKLPQNVRDWIEYTGVIGKEKIVSAHVRQKAEMKLEEDKPWIPVEAEQYFTSDEPGFIWNAKIKFAPLFHISGRDKYQNGKGNMLIKILSLLTIADSKGEEIDQGSLLRYLAESMWFPTAVLNEYIAWEEIDRYHAKATMTYGGISASGIYTFNDEGQVISFEAKRYGEFNGEFSLETWLVSVGEYKEFNGINIPSKGNVTWRLETGDFNWFNFELTDIEYNIN